jgi:hypothetical protein
MSWVPKFTKGSTNHDEYGNPVPKILMTPGTGKEKGEDNMGIAAL